MTQYIALIHKESDSGFGVSFPDLPGVTAVADTLDLAVKEAGVVLGFALEDWDGELPRASDASALVASGQWNAEAIAVSVRYDRGKHENLPDLLIYCLHVVGGFSMAEIAEIFAVERQVVLNICHEVEDRRDDLTFDKMVTAFENSFLGLEKLIVLGKSKPRPKPVNQNERRNDLRKKRASLAD